MNSLSKISCLAIAVFISLSTGGISFSQDNSCLYENDRIVEKFEQCRQKHWKKRDEFNERALAKLSSGKYDSNKFSIVNKKIKKKICEAIHMCAKDRIDDLAAAKNKCPGEAIIERSFQVESAKYRIKSEKQIRTEKCE